jgi:putative heme-binding domain-containing protein
LGELLRPRNPEPLQKAAIAALGRFAAPAMHQLLLENWPRLTPGLRADAVTVLLMRPERVQALLDAVEAGAILGNELSAATLASLRRHADLTIRDRARKLLPATSASTREDVLRAFAPALALRGDSARGERIYLERCASCHRAGSLGYALGPDLATVKTAGREKVLVSILDPNREVAPHYVSYSIETRSGDTHAGLVTSESSTSVQLRAANGWETAVSRDQMISIRSSEVSMMPEGLEAGLTVQDMADLLERILEDH